MVTKKDFLENGSVTNGDKTRNPEMEVLLTGGCLPLLLLGSSPSNSGVATGGMGGSGPPTFVQTPSWD